MKKKKTSDKTTRKQIAQRRIITLFEIAQTNAEAKRFDLADRNIDIARRLSMRYLTPIPNEFKKRFCKHCYSYLIPSINCRVRIHHSKTIIYCKNCNKFTRIPIK